LPPCLVPLPQRRRLLLEGPILRFFSDNRASPGREDKVIYLWWLPLVDRVIRWVHRFRSTGDKAQITWSVPSQHGLWFRRLFDSAQCLLSHTLGGTLTGQLFVAREKTRSCIWRPCWGQSGWPRGRSANISSELPTGSSHQVAERKPRTPLKLAQGVVAACVQPSTSRDVGGAVSYFYTSTARSLRDAAEGLRKNMSSTSTSTPMQQQDGSPACTEVGSRFRCSLVTCRYK